MHDFECYNESKDVLERITSPRLLDAIHHVCEMLELVARAWCIDRRLLMFKNYQCSGKNNNKNNNWFGEVRVSRIIPTIIVQRNTYE